MGTAEGLLQPKVVRRFTDELKPDSDLAIQVKSYQHDMDIEEDEQVKLRMDHIYYNAPFKQSSFTGVEIARQALQAKCDEFFKALHQKEEANRKKSSLVRLLYRNPAEQTLAREIAESADFTVKEVEAITNQVKDRWEGSHSKVTANFVKICQKLDAHKQIFQCFPSQTAYTSALCGAVTMIIQASVNYSTIAEQLSDYVAELSESITMCTTWLSLYADAAMQARLSDIYTQFFDFFVKVATWYLKPKTSKWLDSFNSNFAAGYKSAMEIIQRSIQLLREQARIQNAVAVSEIKPYVAMSLASFEDRITAEVIQSRKNSNESGKKMYDLLLEMARDMDSIRQYQHTLYEHRWSEALSVDKTLLMDTVGATAIVQSPPGITRIEAEQHCQHLQSLIDQVGGKDGIKQAIQAGRLVAEPAMIYRLGQWTQATSGDALILWISNPFEAGPRTSAQLAALGMIWTAIQADAKFISYLCQRPHYGRIPGFRNTEDKAGVLAMAYGLIRQLLQFQLADDELLLAPEMLEGLAASETSWDTALGLLKILLENTRTLRYCMISEMNLLEGGARDMCRDLVEVLLAHARNAAWPVRILFTTSGQSRVLSQTVSKESLVATSNTFRQTKGRVMYRDMKMPA